MCLNPITIKVNGENRQFDCGKCVICQTKRKRNWVIKIVNENKYHKEKCFVTCTFDNKILRSKDKNINKYGANPKFVYNINYSKEYVQKFIKRVRKKYCNKKISFFHVAEYGDKTQRPHHHFIFWGTNFNKDKWKKTFPSKSGKEQFISIELQSLWGAGNTTIEDINTYNSLYIAEYTNTKIKNSDILKPKMTFSNRSKVGIKYIRRFKEDILRDYLTTEDGSKFGIPKAYKRQFLEEKIYEKESTRKIVENLQNKEIRQLNYKERKHEELNRKIKYEKRNLTYVRDF